LFQAIIVQALEDALNPSGFKKETYWKEDAHRWFIENSEDFQNVCWSAEMDPEMIRGEYLKLLRSKKIKFTRTSAALVKLSRAVQTVSGGRFERGKKRD
jgi:hypothetical protein